ncbi:MAG: Fur family transcriptional regulator [Candidatus Odinarchaeia archaeon]
MERKIKENNLKLTPQRLKLVKILEEIGKKHPSFTQIYEEIKKDQPQISKSTVYNNLNKLIELNLITNFEYNNETRYEINLNPHINLLKPNGEIQDIENKKIQYHLNKIKSILKQNNKKIKKITVLVE